MSSPCIQRCRDVGGLCAGCGRTLDEIAHWSVLSAQRQQQVRDELEGRRQTHHCPDCGGPAFCALRAGEPVASCWCNQARPLTAALPAAGSPCLCRRCLARRLAEQD